MSFLINYFQRKKALKNDVRLSTINGFRKHSSITLEEHVRLSDIIIDLPKKTPCVEIGAFTYIRSKSILMAVSKIGRFCSIGRNVVIGQDPRNHPIDWVSSSPVFCSDYDSNILPAQIGHDVWIGHNAVIFAGVKIGNGAVIGMNALVTKDVPDYSIVAGNPARPIKKRFDLDTVNKLLNSTWWNYEVDELKKYDFSSPIEFSNQTRNLKQVATYKKIYIKNKKIRL